MTERHKSIDGDDATLDRLLGDNPGLSPGEREAILDHVLQASTPKRSQLSLWRFVRVGSFAVAASLAAIVFVKPFWPQPSDNTEFSARGHGAGSGDPHSQNQNAKTLNHENCATNS